MALLVQQPQNAIVVDPGSYSLKVGLAVDPAPLFNLPPVGIRDSVLVDGAQLGSALCESELFQRDHLPVVMTLSRQSQPSQVVNLCEILLNNTEVVCIQPQEQANVYYAGRQSCVLVDVGFQSTRVCGLYDGAYSQISKLGWDLSRIDAKVGELLKCQNSDEILKLKQRYFMCLENASHFGKIASSTSLFRQPVQLPDGQQITLNTERFKLYDAPQALTTIVQQHANEVLSCHMRRNESFSPDVVLVGGGSLLSGFPEVLASQLVCGRVLASRDRGHAAWLGTAVWVSFLSQQQNGVRRHDLQEFGERVVDRFWGQ